MSNQWSSISSLEKITREGQMESQSGHQVIERAALILRSLESEPAGMTVAAVTRSTGLARTTVTRLVCSLRQEGFVTVDDGNVRLGPALVRMAHAANLDAADIVRPYIEGLSNELSETVDLWIERREACELVDEVVSDAEVRISLSAGTRLPLHTTACGKALLARRANEELVERLPKRLPTTTPKSIGSRAQLLENLETVRESGVAIDDEEHAPGVCAVGVAVDLRLPDRYAICVPMLSSRFQAQRARAVEALQACVKSIEDHVVGHPGAEGS
ncbi:MAG: IclR family transcriptional regulator [Phycisphaerales bacterium JB047]